MATNTAYGRSALTMILISVGPALAVAAEPQDEGWTPPVCKYCPDYSGASGWAEVGAGYQTEDSAPFGRYTGLNDDGIHGVINGRAHYQGKDGRYLDAGADDLGLDSRRLLIEGGAQGTYDLSIEYDEIPNYRDRTSYSPYRGNGNRLTLPQNWVPGATTFNLPTLGQSLRRTPLETQRDRLGLGFAFIPHKDWEVFGTLRREEKDGTLDLGTTFGFSQTVILPTSVDQETDTFSLGVGYNGDRMQARIAYDGSIYRNDESTLVWQNPFVVAGDPAAFGRQAGPPDNQFHQISALLGYSLSATTRLDGKLAFGRMTQDDAFLPYSINPLFAANALPANDLDAEVQTTLAEFRVSSRPTPRLRLNLDYTYSDRDNETDRRAWDYVTTDRANPPGTRTNTPYGFTQNLLRAKLAYRLPWDMEAQAGLDYDRMERDYQSVKETEDTTLWGRLGFRPVESVDVAFKLSHAHRDASSYQAVAHLTNFAEVQNPLMRIHNLTDRDRNKVGGSVSWMMTPAVTLAVDLDFYHDDYDDTRVGLQQASGKLVSADAAFVISEGLTASAFLTRDHLESSQAGQTFWNPNAAWSVEDRYTTNTFGLGVNWTPRPDKLDIRADLTYTEFRGEIDYPGGQRYPDLESDVTALNLRGDYKLDAHQSLVFRWRYEKYDEKDYAKDGIVNTASTVLDLGRAGYDDEAVMVSAAYRYKFD